MNGRDLYFRGATGDDRDGDGLWDAYEVTSTRTDVTDGINPPDSETSMPGFTGKGLNGVWDGGEDFDGDKLSNIAEMKFRKDPFVSDNGIAPKKVLIYYGFPVGINGSGGNITTALTHFRNYDYVVLGGRALPWVDANLNEQTTPVLVPCP